METIDKIHAIFKAYVGTSQRLTDEEKYEWARTETKADYEAFLTAFGRDIQAAVLWVRCLSDAPHVPAEHRIVAVKKQLSMLTAGVTGKTVQELETENETLKTDNKRLREENATLKSELAEAGRAFGSRN